jgi:hypothetical protein
MATDFEDWITSMEEKNMFLKRAEWDAIPTNQLLEVVRPDYVRFLWAEEHHDLKHGRDHVHTIKDLFQSDRFQTSQTSQRPRTDWIIKTETPNHIRFNEFAQDVTNFETKVRTTAREWIDCEVFESKEGWICCGSGDGWSRFILLEPLMQMGDQTVHYLVEERYGSGSVLS